MPSTLTRHALPPRRATAVLVTTLLCLPLATQAQTQTQSRGELLYRTHCAECHSSQLHWRERKVVRDWPSLTAQVRFWQTQALLNWTDDDVMQVATYLNATYYRLPPQAERKLASR